MPRRGCWSTSTRSGRGSTSCSGWNTSPARAGRECASAGGFLDPQVLGDGLPYWGEVPVLALDAGRPSRGRRPRWWRPRPSWGRWCSTSAGVRARCGPRWSRRATWYWCSPGPTLTELAAAYAVASSVSGRTGLLLRPGPVPRRAATEAVGVPLIARWPSVRRAVRVRSRRPAEVHRALRRAAADVVARRGAGRIRVPAPRRRQSECVDRCGVRRRVVSGDPIDAAVRAEAGGVIDDAVFASLSRDAAAQLVGAGPLEPLLSAPGSPTCW